MWLRVEPQTSGSARERVRPRRRVGAGEGARGDGEVEGGGNGLVADAGIGGGVVELGCGRGGGTGGDGVGVGDRVRRERAGGVARVARRTGDGGGSGWECVRAGGEGRRGERDVPPCSQGLADVEGLGLGDGLIAAVEGGGRDRFVRIATEYVSGRRIPPPSADRSTMFAPGENSTSIGSRSGSTRAHTAPVIADGYPRSFTRVPVEYPAG